MVMQLTASQAKSIHITDWLDRGQTRYLDQLDARGNDGLFLAGQTGGNGVYFHGELKVKTEGGTVETIGNRLIVKDADTARSEEHTSELQSRGHLVCRLLLEKKKEHNQQYK